jgi:hypothetical protein
MFCRAERQACVTSGVSRGSRLAHPTPETLDRDNQAVTGRGNGFEKRFWSRWHIVMEHEVSGVLSDAEVHASGMQIDTTVKWVLVGGESPEVSSSVVRGFFQHTTEVG